MPTTSSAHATLLSWLRPAARAGPQLPPSADTPLAFYQRHLAQLEADLARARARSDAVGEAALARRVIEARQSVDAARKAHRDPEEQRQALVDMARRLAERLRGAGSEAP